MDVAVFLCPEFSFTYIITSAVQHSSLKEPLLNAMAEPLVIDPIICFSACSFGWYNGIHVWSSICGCVVELVIPVPIHLTVQCLTLFYLVLSGSIGVREYNFRLFWWSFDESLCFDLLGVGDRLSSIVLFSQIFFPWREIIPILLRLVLAMVIAVFFKICLGLLSAYMFSVGPLAISLRSFG